MISIAVGNFKGGVGKTTTAIQISGLLAYAEKRVLLLDLDTQINSALCLGLDPRKTDASSIQTHLIYTDYPELANLKVGIYQGKNLFDILHQTEIQSAFDYVILDLPPKSIDFYEHTLQALEYILVPFQCEYFAMEGLAQFLSLFQKVKRQTQNSNLTILGYLVTLFEGTAHQKEVLQEIRKHFQKDLFKTMIPKDPIFSESASFGKPAFLYQPSSIGAIHYIQLVMEILERLKKNA